MARLTRPACTCIRSVHRGILLVMKLRWPLILTVLGGTLAWEVATHPYGGRFAVGIWPVPNGTPWTYQLESGFVPALTVLTLLGSLVSVYRVHTCHRDHCWRLGKHKVDGTPWCNRHHGEAREKAAATLEDVVARLDTLAALPASLDALTAELRAARPAPRTPPKPRTKSAPAQ